MKYSNFITSVSNNNPPKGISKLLLSMWHALRGEWDTAHEIVQDIKSKDAAWIHAYLHRVEGDLSNANYWYNRASRNTSNLSLASEEKKIVMDLIT